MRWRTKIRELVVLDVQESSAIFRNSMGGLPIFAFEVAHACVHVVEKLALAPLPTAKLLLSSLGILVDPSR